MNQESSDVCLLDVQPKELQTDSLGELELDECPSFQWERPEEKFVRQYHTYLENTFEISVKSTEATMIPVKFKILKPKREQNYRLFASVTNSFTSQVISKNLDICLGPSQPKAVLKLGIKPRIIIDEGWAIESLLSIQIKAFHLKGNKKLNKLSKQRKRSRKSDGDAEYENTDIDETQNFRVPMISSRANQQKAAKIMRIDQFLQDSSITENAEIAIGFSGLKNQGATCYMNSFLQVLFHIPLFRNLIYSINTTNEDEKTSIVLNLQRLFGLMQMSSEAVDTERLTTSFGWNEAEANVQHDIEEFSRVLMDAIKYKIRGTKESKEIEKMFSGVLLQTIHFPAINQSTEKPDTFEDLQLVVSTCPDLYSSFFKYVEPQQLPGYKIEKYGTQNAIMKSSFAHLPDVLLLHLQRFEYDPGSGQMTKVNSRYQFPTEIDLKDHMTAGAAEQETSEFTLTGVIVHSGNPIGGHYYSYLKTKNDNQWYLFNDSSVTIASEEKAVTANFGGSGTVTDGPLYGKTKTYSAYMLIYVRSSELSKIYEPVTVESIPQHIIDYVKVQLQLQIERIAAGTTTRFNLYDKTSISDSIAHALPPLTNSKEPLIISVKLNSTTADLYSEVSSVMQSEIGCFKLWSVAKPKIIAPIPNSTSLSIKSLQTASLFFEELSTRSAFQCPLLFFFAMFDPTNSSAPFKYIKSLSAHLNETPSLLMKKLFSDTRVSITDDLFLVYGQKSPNSLTKIDKMSSFNDLGLINSSIIVLQVANGSDLANLPYNFFAKIENEPADKPIWYYDSFPEELPSSADISYASFNNTFLFTIFQNKENAIQYKCQTPSTISFECLKKFIASINGKTYNPETDYGFLYRTTEHIPINDDNVNIKGSFKKYPEENLISLISMPKVLCPDKEKNIRLIVDYSPDSVHIQKRIIKTFFVNGTVEDVIEYFRNKLAIPESKELRVVWVKDNKIKNIYADDDMLTDLENPVRLDVVPDDQSNLKGADFLARVSYVGKDHAETKKCCGIPFFFLLKGKEPFSKTKKRLIKATGIPESEFNSFSFKMKQMSSYGTHPITDDMILANQMSENDRLYIVFPGSEETIAKRRSSPVNISLKINH